MLKRHLYNHNFLFPILICITLSATFGLVACEPQEADLPFETIEQKEWAGTGQAYEALEPGLMVFTLTEQLDSLTPWITENAKAKLLAVDYDKYFILVVFQGKKSTTGYGVDINRIARLENAVNVYAQFQVPKPDEAKADAITSPYQLVQVQKVGTWGQEVRFNLIVEDVTVTSTSSPIP
jgi:protease stability complex PrcB-like protein